MNKENEGELMKRVGGIALFLFTAWAWLSPTITGAAEVRERAEAEGIKPAFASTEVLDNFERYAKMFHEMFGAR